MSDKNPTENHELPRPSPGSFEGSWGEDVMNDDLTAKLEERIPIVDDADSRNEYEAYSGAAFIARDTGQISVGDGESWEFIGSVAEPDSVIQAIDGAEITPDSVDTGSLSTDEINGTMVFRNDIDSAAVNEQIKDGTANGGTRVLVE